MTALAIHTPSPDLPQTTRDHLVDALMDALGRQEALRARSERFDERARLQSEIHALRAAIAQTAASSLVVDEPLVGSAPEATPSQRSGHWRPSPNDSSHWRRRVRRIEHSNVGWSDSILAGQDPFLMATRQFISLR